MNLLQKQYALNILRNEGDTTKALNLSYTTIDKRTANKWLKTKEFKEYQKELQDSTSAAVGVDAVYVLNGYKRLYEDCLRGDSRYDSEGNFIDRKPDRTTAKGTLDSMARMLGLDAPKEVNISVDLSTWISQETIKPLGIIDVEAETKT